ncbi:MAG: class I adenylate-forming enzyme family protein [Myxococcota bacterium]
MIEAPTLWELVERRADETPDLLFAIDESGRELSFADFRAEAVRMADALYAQGLRPGQAVSWMLPTRIQAFVLMVALARLGVIQNPLVPIYGQREMEFCLKQTRAGWLLLETLSEGPEGGDRKALAGAIRRALPELKMLGIDALEVQLGSPSSRAPSDFDMPESRPEERGKDARPPVRWIFYTSGTTSAPKGAKHTDQSILVSSKALVTALELAPGSRTGVVFPVTHLGGANALASTLQAGSTQLVVERFDPSTTIPFLAKHGVTHAGAGTVFYQAYLEAQRASGEAPIFPKLKTLYGGGAPTPESLHHAVRRELGGLGILSTYGMTECPIICMARSDDPEEKRCTTEGRVTQVDTGLRILDPEGQSVQPGETGEIFVRAPQQMLGYVDQDLDADAFDADGYLRTGDLGRVDDAGYLTITGRKKDVIIRKGENISAQEIEDLLAEHPAVAEVAAIGLPDPDRGEICCAVIRTTASEAPLSAEAMQTFLKARGLMKQKIPERLEFVDGFPRNPSGKVIKQALRERYAPSDGPADPLIRK